MDTNTQQLIEKYADKLGVTVGHLWEVLVRQAPISATIDTIVVVVTMVAIYWMGKATIAAGRKANEDGDFVPVSLICGIIFATCLGLSNSFNCRTS